VISHSGMNWYTEKGFKKLMEAYMEKIEIGSGVVHSVPEDLIIVLRATPDLLEKWNDLTPLQRNEWICWLTIVKKEVTRKDHLERLSRELLEGKRRPCCWPGCPHRNEQSKKWFKNIKVEKL